jgi:hypothetical protein
VVLGSCNYIKPACGLFGGCSWLIISFGEFLISLLLISVILVGAWK